MIDENSNSSDEQQDSQRFIDGENARRLIIAEEIALKAEALSLEYQRELTRLTVQLGEETDIEVFDFHETIDACLHDMMGDTFAWAVRELEDE